VVGLTGVLMVIEMVIVFAILVEFTTQREDLGAIFPESLNEGFKAGIFALNGFLGLLNFICQQHLIIIS
jgi:hypothetical protein